MPSTVPTGYLELGKFRLSLLVLFTASIGYGVSAKQLDWPVFLGLLAGTMLCSMGANGLNQCWEYKRDARMARTKNRPIPSGRISLGHGIIVTTTWLMAGIVILILSVNMTTAYLAILTFASYLFIYTPLKTYNSVAVLVGAIPGAIPPVMGWTAATGEISNQAWVLACIMYLWQIPHFMSLAAIYRKDYARGGYKLLPDNPELEQATRSIIVVFSIALLGISLLAPLAGLGERLFGFGALLSGAILLYLSILFYRSYSLKNARRIFFASIIYLPVVMGLLLVDQRLILF